MRKFLFIVFIGIFFIGCFYNEPTPIMAKSVIKNTSKKKLIDEKYRTMNVNELISNKNPQEVLDKYIDYLKCNKYSYTQINKKSSCLLSRSTDYKNIKEVIKYLISNGGVIKNKKQKSLYYKKLAYLFNLLNDNPLAVLYLKKSLKIDRELCKNINCSFIKRSSYCISTKEPFSYKNIPLLYDYYKLMELSLNLNDGIYYSKKVIKFIDKFSIIKNLQNDVNNRLKYFTLLSYKLTALYNLSFFYKKKNEYKKALKYLREGYNLDKLYIKENFKSDINSRQKNYIILENLNRYHVSLINSKLNYLINKARILKNIDRKEAKKVYLEYFKNWKNLNEIKRNGEIKLIKFKYNRDINSLKKCKSTNKTPFNACSLVLMSFHIKEPSQIDSKIYELKQKLNYEIEKIKNKYSYIKQCNQNNFYYPCVREFDALLNYLDYFKLIFMWDKDKFLVNLLKYIETNKLYYRNYDGFSVNEKSYLYYIFGKYFFNDGNYKLALRYLIKSSDNASSLDLDLFDGEYYYMLGVSSQRIGFYIDAFKFYEKAISLMNKDIVLVSEDKQKKLTDYSKEIIANMIDTAIEARKKFLDLNGVLFQKAINYSLNYKNSLFEIENYIVGLYYKTKDEKLKNLIRKYFLLKRELNHALIINNSKKVKSLKEKIKIIYNQILFLKPYKTKFVTQKDVANALKENELFVNIVYFNDKYYIFYFDSKGNIGWKLFNYFNSQKLNKNIRKYRKITKKSIYNPNDNNLIKEKKGLTSKIFEEIFRFLRDDKNMPLNKYKKIIISPDGALRLVAFGELYDTENKKYLIQEKKLIYISSARFLIEDIDNKNVKRAVIFADPIFDKKIKQANEELREINSLIQSRNILGNLKVTSLPSTLKEAKLIKHVLRQKRVDEKLYLKDKATSENLLKVNSPTILHLATHGFFIDDNLNPMLKSGILLTGANESIDGIVTALRLSGVNLKSTNLVVLSACDTGVVGLSSTDSIGALNKSFLLAGANNVITTLWSIDDNKTVEFMKLFYKNYLNGSSVSKALRDTQINFINRGYSSTYWAPFIIYSKGSN